MAAAQARRRAVQWFIRWKKQFGERLERFWRLDEIEAGYRDEHPDWSEAEVRAKSQQLFEAQRQLLNGWYNSQRRFCRHNSLIGLDPDKLDQAEDG